jgi:hypothetical protein
VLLQIAANSCGSEQHSVWTRALSDDEVSALYRRAAYRLQLQVRSCAAADCSDALFVGVDATAASYFEERWNQQNMLPSFTLSTLTLHRYFQYQARFESDRSAESPELRVVQVEARYP